MPVGTPLPFVTGIPGQGVPWIGRGHPSLPDTANGLVMDILTRSGVALDDVSTAAFPGFALVGSGGGGSTAWSAITGKPTTIAGYGITDAFTQTLADARYYTKAQSDAAYLTQTLGDARYYTKAQSDAAYLTQTLGDARYALIGSGGGGLSLAGTDARSSRLMIGPRAYNDAAGVLGGTFVLGGTGSETGSLVVGGTFSTANLPLLFSSTTVNKRGLVGYAGDQPAAAAASAGISYVGVTGAAFISTTGDHGSNSAIGGQFRAILAAGATDWNAGVTAVSAFASITTPATTGVNATVTGGSFGASSRASALQAVAIRGTISGVQPTNGESYGFIMVGEQLNITAGRIGIGDAHPPSADGCMASIYGGTQIRDYLRLTTNRTPSADDSSGPAGTVGDISTDDSYLYHKVIGSGANRWRRMPWYLFSDIPLTQTLADARYMPLGSGGISQAAADARYIQLDPDWSFVEYGAGGTATTYLRINASDDAGSPFYVGEVVKKQAVLAFNIHFNGSAWQYDTNGFAGGFRLNSAGPGANQGFALVLSPTNTGGTNSSTFDSTDMALVGISGNQFMVNPGTYNPNFGSVARWTVNPNSTPDNAASSQFNSDGAATKVVVVQGYSGQSVSLQEWQNSTGSKLAAIDQAGYLVLPGALRHRGRTSSAADPTTTELPTDKDFSLHKNTASGALFLACNDAGTIKKVALT